MEHRSCHPGSPRTARTSRAPAERLLESAGCGRQRHEGSWPASSRQAGSPNRRPTVTRQALTSRRSPAGGRWSVSWRLTRPCPAWRFCPGRTDGLLTSPGGERPVVGARRQALVSPGRRQPWTRPAAAAMTSRSGVGARPMSSSRSPLSTWRAPAATDRRCPRTCRPRTRAGRALSGRRAPRSDEAAHGQDRAGRDVGDRLGGAGHHRVDEPAPVPPRSSVQSSTPLAGLTGSAPPRPRNRGWVFRRSYRSVAWSARRPSPAAAQRSKGGPSDGR